MARFTNPSVSNEFLQGVSQARGAISRQVLGTVNIDSANTYVPMDLVPTADDSSFNMSLPSTHNVTGLKNTGSETRLFVVIATYDGKGGNNHAIGLKLALNGVPIDQTECTSFGGGGGQFAKAMTQWMLYLDPGDEISMYAANKDTSNNLSIARLKMIAYSIA